MLSFYSITGKLVKKNVNPYRIIWNGPSPSKFQYKVKQILKHVWSSSDIVFEELPCAGTKLRIDFYNATKKVAVEADGPQHDKFNPFFHNNSRLDFLLGIKRDVKKYKWLELNDIKLIQIIENDFKDINALYSRIYNLTNS